MYKLRVISLGVLAMLALAGGQAQAADPTQTAVRVDLRGKTSQEAKDIISKAAVEVCQAEYSQLDYRADPIDRITFGKCVQATTRTAVTSYLARRGDASRMEVAIGFNAP
jgi:hypothetical protein